VTGADEMSCKELVEVITEYLEGTLPAPDRSRFEEHLAQCSGCRNYLEQMRRTVETMGRLSPDRLCEEDRHRLLQLFRGWQQREQS
jgi:anti-sigma factor RsiW